MLAGREVHMPYEEMLMFCEFSLEDSGTHAVLHAQFGDIGSQMAVNEVSGGTTLIHHKRVVKALRA